MKKLIRILKRVTFSFAFLYSFNILVSSLNLNIGVNPFSVALVSTLGLPGMITLIVLKLIIK